MWVGAVSKRHAALPVRTLKAGAAHQRRDRLREEKRMTTDDAATVKSVANGDSIDVQVPSETLQAVLQRYDVDEQEAARWIVETGAQELCERADMLVQEAGAYRDDDGRHVVPPFGGDAGEQ